MVKINKKEARYYYQQIKDILLNEVQKIEIGERFYSEREIAKKFDVSRETARRALDLLIKRGLIYKVPGKGVFRSSFTSSYEERYQSKITFAFVVKSIMENEYPFVNRISDGISFALRNNLLINQTFLTVDKLVKYLSQPGVEQGDLFQGLILNGSDIDASILEQLNSLNLPYIVVGDKVEGVPEHDYIYYDVYEGTKELLEKVIEKGHKNIGVIAGHMRGLDLKKIAAYKDVLKSHKIKFDDNYIIPTNYDTQIAIKSVIPFIKSYPEITVLFCFDDLLAANVIRVLKKNNIQVPDDISVVGFNDFDIAKLIIPSITTMRIDLFAIGKLAGEMLLERIRKNIIDSKPMSLRLKPEFIQRESLIENKK